MVLFIWLPGRINLIQSAHTSLPRQEWLAVCQWTPCFSEKLYDCFSRFRILPLGQCQPSKTYTGNYNSTRNLWEFGFYCV